MCIDLGIDSLKESPLTLVSEGKFQLHDLPYRLSDKSGLGNNPENRQIDLSSGVVGTPKYLFFSIFSRFFLKKT